MSVDVIPPGQSYSESGIAVIGSGNKRMLSRGGLNRLAFGTKLLGRDNKHGQWPYISLIAAGCLLPDYT